MFLRSVYAAAFCTILCFFAVQQAVSIVKARRHVGMNHNLCGFLIEKISNSSNTVEMEICHTTYMLHAVFMLRALTKKLPMLILSNSGNRHNGVTKFYNRHRKFVLDVWCTHYNNSIFCSIEFQLIHTHPILYVCDKCLNALHCPNCIFF